jgi:ABC-type transport system involved in multi-copper enzyme maturation permease subunit
MLASWRAELLVLRKSRVAWALVLVAPLLVLVQVYLFQFLTYLGLTPAMYATYGSPAQNLPSLLPGQFAIQTVNQLSFSAPFILLGAVIVGGAWGSGTLRTALLQGQGRVRCFGGQVLAIMTACAASVLASFALAALASVAIRGYVGGVLAGGAAGAFPPVIVMAQGVGAGLLIGFAYGALGIALGTLFRSAAGGVAAALIWYAIADGFLFELSLNAGGWFQHLYNVLPGASLITLTSMFGSPGGGAASATYQPVSPWNAAEILAGYAVASLTLALILVLRRDITAPARRRLIRPRVRPAGPRASRRPGPRASRRPGPRASRRPGPRASRRPGPQAPAGAGAGRGVLASARSELLIMARWPAMWAFVLILPVFTLLGAYVEQFVLYLGAGSGAISLATPAQVLPSILPGQFVQAVLNSIGDGFPLQGTAAFFLIGALAAGRDWADGTIKTSLLQGPTRAWTSLGQALAVLIAAALSVLLTFAVAGVFSVLTAVGVTGSASPAAGPLPTAGRLAAAVGLALVVAAAWAAAGWTAGTLLRSATAAFAVILLWATIVQLQLDQLASEFTGPLRALYDLLPDAATNTLTNLYGFAESQGNPIFGQVAPALAVLTLAVYVLACFVLPVIVTRRRDVI